MLVQIGNWLYQNAMAIFISAIASLLISKRYYDKANRESVLMMVIFPIVKLLNEKYYTRNDYEALFEINSSYAVKYLRKKERNKLLELLSAYRDVCKYSKENADTSCIMAYYNYKLKEKGINPKPCESSPNLCVNSSFSYVVLSTLLLSSRDLTEWSLVYHNTLSYQRFYDLHSIHYDHLEGLHQLI